MDQSRFGCGICKRTSRGIQAGRRCNVNNTSLSSSCFKKWCGCLRQQKWASEVGVQNPVPNFNRERIQILEANFNVPCRVVDQNVKAFKLISCRLNSLSN